MVFICNLVIGFSTFFTIGNVASVMREFRFSIILLAFFILNSCEKDLIKPVENQDMSLLTREIYSEELFYEYSWNEQNLLSESKSKYFYTSYSYNSSNQLISYDMYEDSRIYSSTSNVIQEAMERTDWVNPNNTEISARVFYSYENEKLSKIETQRFTTNYQGVSTYEQDENGRISKQIFYYEDQPSGYVEYKYDNSGNLILKQHFYSIEGKGVLSSTTSYEFDQKKNPYKAFNRLLIPGRYTNENNIVKETLTLNEKIPGVDQVQVSESSYEYNRLGYPVLKDKLIRYEYR